MVIDSFVEWAVILIGILLALAVLFPGFVSALGEKLKPPHPTDVRIWLGKFGL